MARKEELILAVRTAGLPDVMTVAPAFYVKGGYVLGDPIKTLEEAGLFLGPRYLLEDMPEFMQIIPYIVIKSGNDYVSYTRTPKGGEARLEGKTSIGVGGHIDLADVVSATSRVHLRETIEDALDRELQEEIPGIQVTNMAFAGLLSDRSNDVGKVHIGLVVTCELMGDIPADNEDALTSVALRTRSELQSGDFNLENWTKLVLTYQ